MKLVNSEIMKALDSRAINEGGIASLELMTNAAKHIAEEVNKYSNGGKIVIFCGSGNNGGDGVACACMLKEQGADVCAWFVGNREKMTPDTAEMERRLIALGGELEEFDYKKAVLSTEDCSVIVDAMLGTGLNTELCENYLQAADIINNSGAVVIAADVPTGISADTGCVMGDAVCADITVTFTLPKIGQFVEPGCGYCGEIKIFDIGIPPEYISEAETTAYLVTKNDVSLPKRRMDSYKKDYGKAAVIGGSMGFTGAPVMAADAASRTGSGLVQLCVPGSIYEMTAIKCTEVMPFPLPCDQDGIISWDAREGVKALLEESDVCLIGPGLGRSYQLRYLIEMMLRVSEIPVVLDADGINNICEYIDILTEASAPVILTPHLGEFKRLGGDVSEGRLKAAVEFAVKYGCYLILKGHGTITACPDGTAYVNSTGGPALAKGGSGDVLAGMVASLLGQKMPCDKACTAAVYLHGLAGDICSERLSEYSVIANDVINAIPEAIKMVLR